MPLPALIDSSSCAEIVDRVLKLTNFSIVCRTWSGEISWIALAMRESVWRSDARRGGGPDATSCARHRGPKNVVDKLITIATRIRIATDATAPKLVQEPPG